MNSINLTFSQLWLQTVTLGIRASTCNFLGDRIQSIADTLQSLYDPSSVVSGVCLVQSVCVCVGVDLKDPEDMNWPILHYCLMKRQLKKTQTFML